MMGIAPLHPSYASMSYFVGWVERSDTHQERRGSLARPGTLNVLQCGLSSASQPRLDTVPDHGFSILMPSKRAISCIPVGEVTLISVS